MTIRQKVAVGLFVIAMIHICVLPTGFGLTLIMGGGVIAAAFGGVLLLTK